MADPIDIAIQSIDARPSPPVDPLDTAMRSANPAQKLASDKLVESADATKQKALSKLPKTKDPELVKKEKEAEARQKAAQVKEGVLNKKSEALDIAKNLALGLAMSKLGKVQGVASSANSVLGTAGAAAATGMAVLGLLKKKKPAAKQTQDMVKADQKTKEVEKERVQTSQENHQKNVTAFTYPLKPIDATPTQPEPPEIPIQPPIPTPTATVPTKPLRSGWTYLLSGGGGKSIELASLRYWSSAGGDSQDILSRLGGSYSTDYAPYYSFSSDSGKYPDGISSVRAKIQYDIDTGTFDFLVTPPY